MSKLEKLLEQEAQLKARIQRERAKLDLKKRQERNGRLIAWGVVIEQMLQEGEMSQEKWTALCQRFLTGRTLERALTGEVTRLPENAL